jgi:hypothetical protein
MGLDSFLPENEATVEFVARRCGAEGQRACFWAVTSEESATQIWSQIGSGDRIKALESLDALAFQVAPLSLVPD